MSYEQFWDGLPEMTVMYRKAYYLRIDDDNRSNWLLGAYIYDAVGKVLANAFAKKGAKQQKYMDKPIRVLPKSDDERLAEAKKEREKLIAALSLWEKRAKGI